MKVKVKCKNCGYTFEVDLKLSPLGPLNPIQKRELGPKIKIDKASLDKILDIAKGASYDELEKMGLDIPIPEWEDALQRATVRRFLLDNLKVAKTKKRRMGEKFVTGTEPFRMGDSFKDISLPASEVASLGVEDIRLVPGVTLQKKVFGRTKGYDVEELKGTKLLVILDGSGSMLVGQEADMSGKVGKALMIAKELYDLSQKFGFEYDLVVFSDLAMRIPREDLKTFFKDISYRNNMRIWNGGTRLRRGLEKFTEAEYKDANVIILSDMELGDISETKDKIIEITKLTNSFKIVLIEHSDYDLKLREDATRQLFPPDVNLQVLAIPVRR